MRSEVIADIFVAAMATVFITKSWGQESWGFQLCLIWGGMCIGYLITVHLNAEDDE
jgi:hypothetical protein